MSVSTASSTSTPNLGSLVLQQLLSGSGNQATSTLPPAVLQALLKQADSGTGSSTASDSSGQTPAAVTQALGELLSGKSGSNAQTDLDTVQTYFKANPSSLTSLLGDLQGAGTYSANGTLASSGNALLAALTGQSSGTTSSSALVTALLGSQSQDPLLAALGGTSSGAASSLSLLG